MEQGGGQRPSRTLFPPNLCHFVRPLLQAPRPLVIPPRLLYTKPQYGPVPGGRGPAGGMVMSGKTVNLEEGMPSVETARRRLSQELASGRANRLSYLKIIHGYGSSGRGGAIKRETHRFLAEKKRAGAIRDYLPGEDFSPFGEAARRAVLPPAHPRPGLLPGKRRHHHCDFLT